MRKLVIAVVFFMLSWGPALYLRAETFFHDDFSDSDNWQDNWYQLGSPGGEILQVDGHLELDRGKLGADKQLSAMAVGEPAKNRHEYGSRNGKAAKDYPQPDTRGSQILSIKR